MFDIDHFCFTRTFWYNSVTPALMVMIWTIALLLMFAVIPQKRPFQLGVANQKALFLTKVHRGMTSIDFIKFCFSVDTIYVTLTMNP